MKFKKKPIVIDASQFKALQTDLNLGVYADPASSTGWSIDTLEGKHEVKINDWIITGVKGEKYPCKPDIFDILYDKVEE